MIQISILKCMKVVVESDNASSVSDSFKELERLTFRSLSWESRYMLSVALFNCVFWLSLIAWIDNGVLLLLPRFL